MGNTGSARGGPARLSFSKKEKLPPRTKCYHLDDGTVFYYEDNYENDEADKLYVKWKGKKVEAAHYDVSRSSHPLSFSYIGEITTHGNAIFFVNYSFNEINVIWKAVFQPSGEILTTDIRHIEEKECAAFKCGLCAIVRDGEVRAYNIYDKPGKGVAVNIPDTELKELTLACIHMKKAFFVSDDSEKDSPIITVRNETLVVIEWQDCHIHSHRDSSPFLYLSNYRNSLFILDTRTMDLVRELQFNVAPGRITNFVGFNNGMVTILAEFGRDTYVMTARLPVEDEKKIDMGYTSFFLKNFDIRKIIGEGEFGCVFEARSRLDKKVYAVKRIHPKCMDVNDAMKEVEVLAALKHDGIVSYNMSWIEEPKPDGWQKNADAELLKKLKHNKPLQGSGSSVFIYIPMEFCEKNLRQWLDANKGDRDQKLVKTWFKQLVTAVGYLHDNGKIHRDMKPQNILVTADNRVKICDLGLVADRALREGEEIDISRTKGTGTLKYMAPEQLQARHGSKVDIFALGLILGEMAVPMTGDEASTIFTLVQQDKPVYFLQRLPDVQSIFQLLTKYNQADRPNCKQILEHSFLRNV